MKAVKYSHGDTHPDQAGYHSTPLYPGSLQQPGEGGLEPGPEQSEQTWLTKGENTAMRYSPGAGAGTARKQGPHSKQPAGIQGLAGAA